MPFVATGREDSAAIRIYCEDHGAGPPVGRPGGDHAGVARCSAIELPPSTTTYCPVM